MFPVSHLARVSKEQDATVEQNVSPNDADSEHGDEFYEDPKAARRLLTKCDIRLIPILGTLYLVSFLDRSNIANARLFGLEKSLHMPSNGFNTCLWIFYLPFVVVEIPSNLFMSLNKVKPHQWLAGAMLILGMFRTRLSHCNVYSNASQVLYLCVRDLLEATPVCLSADSLWASWKLGYRQV